MPKRSIRSRFLAERKALSLNRCAALSKEVQEQFLRSGCLLQADCVALYSAIHNEVNTESVARQVLAAGKRLVYPRVCGEALEFVEVPGLDALTPGAFGVLEPRSGPTVSIADLDLVVVPGVVFDRTGHRLGYGRGYYDRCLSLCREDSVKVGFAYDFQVVETLPTAGHDRTLSLLMTDKRIFDFRTPAQHERRVLTVKQCQ